MRIGLDFDNTIVGYDHVFFAVARERNLVPRDLPRTKLAVRDHLRGAGNEAAWTELQGHVYGARMADALPFPGVLSALRRLRRSGCELFIVSHKTRHPYRGPAYDLHEAAARWIGETLRDEAGPLIKPGAVSFHQAKDKKIARIAALDCDVFVDDLPEIFSARSFPNRTVRVLFDPDAQHDQQPDILRLRAWKDAERLILEGVRNA